jgi:hypothetical protein
VREYALDLTQRVPVRLRVNAGCDFRLEIRWNGQIVYERPVRYDTGPTADITFLPPLTGRYVVHVGTATKRVSILLSAGTKPTAGHERKDQL